MRPILTTVAMSLTLCFLSTNVLADEQIRNVSSFNIINTQSACKIIVEVGKTQSITLRGDTQFIEKFSTIVVGNELTISDKSKRLKITDADQIIITVPELKKFNFQGAGSTKINNLNSDNFELLYEGAGSLTANGKVSHLTIRSQGVGSIDTKDVSAQEVDVRGEGIGSISVTAFEKLNATLQGIGSLTYYGHPRTIKKSVEGIGSIKAGD
ncbi:DUF2807 domain-containing protein [Undibacterium jejuense]|uniref:DUF2807 domain-containing protein n=1 Tax=Undibacterium jejuense TaxID=1344949 RepID=A0A923KNY2_9BURK|nr:DUF2807 domain-containing protein [Undibacterium jejuense]MBC3861614.1 DUF2807 domain-containing protein [Undibacterium jejuense]